MNMAKKSEYYDKPEPQHAQAGPQQEEKKPGGGGKGGGGGGNAPDDSWRKQSEPHPIVPGKPAPQGPEEQQKKEAKLVSQEPDAHLEIVPAAQTGGPMPAPLLATGSTMARPYRNPIAPPNANTGPKNPPTSGAWPWG